MPHVGFFPWRWGAEPSTVTVVTVPGRWTRAVATSARWLLADKALMPRFDRVFDKPVVAFGNAVNFSFTIQSEYPAVIASDTGLLIASTLSNP